MRWLKKPLPLPFLPRCSALPSGLHQHQACSCIEFSKFFGVLDRKWSLIWPGVCATLWENMGTWRLILASQFWDNRLMKFMNDDHGHVGFTICEYMWIQFVWSLPWTVSWIHFHGFMAASCWLLEDHSKLLNGESWSIRCFLHRQLLFFESTAAEMAMAMDPTQSRTVASAMAWPGWFTVTYF